MSRYILFLAKLKERERPFLEGARRGGANCEITDVIRDEKVSPFVKFELILPFLCFLLYPLRNKHCRTWGSMINLWIDSRTCEKQRILLLARLRPNNYLELSEENALRNMMLSHWPCFTWKFFIIWFHTIVKLILKAAIIF